MVTDLCKQLLLALPVWWILVWIMTMYASFSEYVGFQSLNILHNRNHGLFGLDHVRFGNRVDFSPALVMGILRVRIWHKLNWRTTWVLNQILKWSGEWSCKWLYTCGCERIEIVRVGIAAVWLDAKYWRGDSYIRGPGSQRFKNFR